jgi:hemoglobin-like flavoprotein
MSPQQIALVRESWQRVLPIKERAAELFYQRLFELEPSLEPPFRGDMTEQGRKLMAMIGTVVSRLDRLGEIVPAVQQLGRRHAQYGVEDEHYDTVGTALLSTLRAGLGDALSREAEEAWAVAYTTLAGVMKQASAEASTAPASGASTHRPSTTRDVFSRPPISTEEPIGAAVRV